MTFGRNKMNPKNTAKIASRDDLAAFIDRMLKDYSKSGTEWENRDIPSFLEAFQAWLQASDNYYNNQNIDLSSVNPWRRIGDAFAAARIYE